MKNLWYTAYVVTALTVLALIYVEWQVPGFVSQVFPVYIGVLVALGCGLGALVTSDKDRGVSKTGYLLTMLAGALLAALVFRSGDAFGAFRLILAIVAFVFPPLLLKALSNVKD